MPVEEFQGRVIALRAGMKDRGLDALMLYGNSLDECGYPTYLSNYTTKLPFGALVLLTKEGAPVLMFQGSTRGQSAAKATTWFKDVRACWDIAATCCEALAEKNLLTSAIGLAGLPQLMPYEAWNTLSAAMKGAKLVDAHSMIDTLRAVKSDREISRIRRARQMIHDALGTLGGVSFRAENETTVAARLMHDVRRQGAEDVRVLIAKPGEPGWAFRPVEDAPLRDGETVAVHMAASWERYWAEAARTYLITGDSFEGLGTPELDLRFETVAKNLRTGRPISDYMECAMREMESANAVLMQQYGFGHGIGVTANEWPKISPESPHRDVVVENRMCFSIQLAFTDLRNRLVIRGETVAVDSGD